MAVCPQPVCQTLSTGLIPTRHAVVLEMAIPKSLMLCSPNDLGIAVLRYSIELQHPGCMHIILENVSSSAPYLLENRSLHPLQYRQADFPGIPYKPLPAFSAAGFVAQVPQSTKQADGLVGTQEEVCLLGDDASGSDVTSIRVNHIASMLLARAMGGSAF